ncbi:DUF397 domain-containing protein [Saccharopolyspora kobensis]|uniref:DUF397 domain-containing protein n=1 Tax=Saccharopolyspora kobensis TaxID=146035 RepID=UPI000B84CFF0
MQVRPPGKPRTGNCVEVASGDGVVAARDSKDPEGRVLVFSRARWAAFLAGLSE